MRLERGVVDKRTRRPAAAGTEEKGRALDVGSRHDRPGVVSLRTAGLLEQWWPCGRLCGNVVNFGDDISSDRFSAHQQYVFPPIQAAHPISIP